MLLVEAEHFAETDGSVLEAPVSSAPLTVTKIVNGNCWQKNLNFSIITQKNFKWSYQLGSLNFGRNLQ